MNVTCILKQLDYCMKNKVNMVIPTDGKCLYCGNDIFEDRRNALGGISEGITLNEAATKYLKQCPHCKCNYEWTEKEDDK